MWVPAHNELHADVKAAPKPYHESILGALSLASEMHSATPPELVEELGHYFSDLGEPIGSNLLRQLPHIEQGLYRK